MQVNRVQIDLISDQLLKTSAALRGHLSTDQKSGCNGIWPSPMNRPSGRPLQAGIRQCRPHEWHINMLTLSWPFPPRDQILKCSSQGLQPYRLGNLARMIPILTEPAVSEERRIKSRFHCDSECFAVSSRKRFKTPALLWSSSCAAWISVSTPSLLFRRRKSIDLCFARSSAR